MGGGVLRGVMLGNMCDMGVGLGRRGLHAEWQTHVSQGLERIRGGSWDEVWAGGCAPCFARASALDTLTVCVQRPLCAGGF